MSRGKSITKLLLDASTAAIFAGIEIHNKPHIAYRYSTAVILVINAWELALKAYVYKYIGKKRIYESKDGYTISFSKALKLVRDDVNRKKKNKFAAVYENLNCLNNYRCSNIHYFEGELDPIIFMLLSKAVLNYDDFLKEFFQRDITREDNLIILPIGMRLPFNPIDYLKQDYADTHNAFVNEVIQTIRTLNADDVKDSIVVGFDLFTSNVKKIDNADIIATIDSQNGNVKLTKSVRVTTDPSAPVVRVSDDIVLPYTYNEIRDKVKNNYPQIKFGPVFNEIMKDIKANDALCQTRYLDPNNKKSTQKHFYSEEAVEAIIARYKLEVNTQ